jgi:hypothetical protein
MLYIPVRVSSLLIYRCVALPSVDIAVLVNLLGCTRMEVELSEFDPYLVLMRRCQVEGNNM